MVAIARYINVTLIVPELDKTSFWNDPSQFEDIFDVDHFITSLRDEVRILKQLPIRLKKRVQLGLIHTMPPVSWSDISYNHNQLNSGKVIGVGLGTRDKSGNTIPVGLKEGDTVLLPEYGGTEVKLGEKQYHLFRDEDILGTLHDYLLMNKLFL